jgi:hypothetical protein
MADRTLPPLRHVAPPERIGNQAVSVQRTLPPINHLAEGVEPDPKRKFHDPTDDDFPIDEEEGPPVSPESVTVTQEQPDGSMRELGAAEDPMDEDMPSLEIEEPRVEHRGHGLAAILVQRLHGYRRG